jgi:hypothetical protein
LTAWTGFRQTTVAFERDRRHKGRTKYNIFRLLELALTSTTSFSVAPLRFAFVVGLLLMLLSLVAIVVIIVQKLTGYRQPPGYAFLLVSIWFLGGIQCMLIGIVGEYLGRTYVEAQQRPLYLVRERLGICPSSDPDDKPSDSGEATE